VAGAVVAAGAVAVAECVAAVVVECVAGAAEAVSVVARPRADFPAADVRPAGQPVAPRVAEGVVGALRGVPASTADRHSVRPAGVALEAALSPEGAHRFSQGRGPPSAVAPVRDLELAQGGRDLELAPVSDRRSAVVARDPELAPGSCRPLAWEEARDPALASPTESGQVSVPVSGRGSARASGRPLCQVSGAEPVWGVAPAWGAGIGLRTCRRRAENAPPACRIGWPAATA
jgi:hypothetical protein